MVLSCRLQLTAILHCQKNPLSRLLCVAQFTKMAVHIMRRFDKKDGMDQQSARRYGGR
jgi:hypothetical protein